MFAAAPIATAPCALHRALRQRLQVQQRPFAEPAAAQFLQLIEQIPSFARDAAALFQGDRAGKRHTPRNIETLLSDPLRPPAKRKGLAHRANMGESLAALCFLHRHARFAVAIGVTVAPFLPSIAAAMVAPIVSTARRSGSASRCA